MRVDKEITEDEAALYDRQIRLWGVDAQKKILSSKVLLINMQGLGAEVAKNLVLSGINSLTLLDSNDVQEDDLNYNFLIRSKTSLNKNVKELIC
jgi:ubiquitin-like 1-activating enzyme E1 A